MNEEDDYESVVQESLEPEEVGVAAETLRPRYPHQCWIEQAESDHAEEQELNDSVHFTTQ